MIVLYEDSEALARTDAGAITSLTERATQSTYFAEGLGEAQLESIVRVNAMAWDCVGAAAASDSQRFIAAEVDRRLAGFVIATLHDEDDRELDWIMVDPEFHGSGVASALMDAGIAWLGKDQPIWLNVIRHNHRAVQFYERHGFSVDRDATTAHIIPHFVMRRRA